MCIKKSSNFHLHNKKNLGSSIKYVFYLYLECISLIQRIDRNSLKQPYDKRFFKLETSGHRF